MVVRAASTRGSSHRYYGTPREDAAGALNIGDRFVGAAVADGIGSVPGSGKAARIAVDYALGRIHSYLAHHPDPARLDLRMVVHEAVAQANAALLHQLQGSPPATTLTVAVASAQPDPDGTYSFAAAGVGDSPAFILSGGRFEQVLAGAPSGELHSTQTAGLPVLGTELLPVRPGRLPAGAVLVLASDGLGDPLSFEDVQRELVDRWKEPPDPINFLVQVQFRRKSYDDDRSAVGIWTPPAGVQRVNSRRLPGVDPAWSPHRELPDPEVLVDAGRIGGLEVRAASIHRSRPGAVGAAVAGEGRVAVAVGQGPATGDPLDTRCRDAVRDALARVRECLLPQPDEPLETLLKSTVAGSAPTGIGLLLAVVDDQQGFSVTRTGGGRAYRLTRGGFVPVTDPYGSLAPGEALVLASEGLQLGPGLAERWSSGPLPPGPMEFLDSLYHPRESDYRGAAVVWAMPEGHV